MRCYSGSDGFHLSATVGVRLRSATGFLVHRLLKSFNNWRDSWPDNYLPFDAFRKRCSEEGESDPVRQEQLARILHALGIILYYGDDPRLRDTTVLNPHWVTESIYKLLRLRAQPGADGTLTLDEARC